MKRMILALCSALMFAACGAEEVLPPAENPQSPAAGAITEPTASTGDLSQYLWQFSKTVPPMYFCGVPPVLENNQVVCKQQPSYGVGSEVIYYAVFPQRSTLCFTMNFKKNGQTWDSTGDICPSAPALAVWGRTYPYTAGAWTAEFYARDPKDRYEAAPFTVMSFTAVNAGGSGTTPPPGTDMSSGSNYYTYNRSAWITCSDAIVFNAGEGLYKCSYPTGSFAYDALVNVAVRVNSLTVSTSSFQFSHQPVFDGTTYPLVNGPTMTTGGVAQGAKYYLFSYKPVNAGINRGGALTLRIYLDIVNAAGGKFHYQLDEIPIYLY